MLCRQPGLGSHPTSLILSDANLGELLDRSHLCSLCPRAERMTIPASQHDCEAGEISHQQSSPFFSPILYLILLFSQPSYSSSSIMFCSSFIRPFIQQGFIRF